MLELDELGKATVGGIECPLLAMQPTFVAKWSVPSMMFHVKTSREMVKFRTHFQDQAQRQKEDRTSHRASSNCDTIVEEMRRRTRGIKDVNNWGEGVG